nr:VOC family protein [Propionicimonas sp.]
MAITLVAYLNFPQGKTREAMTYYQDVFGGTLDVLTFGDYGMADMPADGTMHARLVTDHFRLMASDAMPGAEDTWGGTRVYLAVIGDEEAKMRAWFDRLSADGTVGRPLEKQVWGDLHGDLRDKFGLEWLFDIGTPQN